MSEAISASETLIVSRSLLESKFSWETGTRTMLRPIPMKPPIETIAAGSEVMLLTAESMADPTDPRALCVPEVEEFIEPLVLVESVDPVLPELAKLPELLRVAIGSEPGVPLVLAELDALVPLEAPVLPLELW